MQTICRTVQEENTSWSWSFFSMFGWANTKKTKEKHIRPHMFMKYATQVDRSDSSTDIHMNATVPADPSKDK